VGRSRFIVVEGLIGVGKTSLCRILEDRWSARLILEPCDDNPFLAAFYSDRDRHAFPAQMFYLATRFAQQQKLQQTDLFDRMVVADYIFAKDRLFAEETLSGDELELYYRFADLLEGGIPKPEFVLFLDAPTDVVVKRIQRRAIDAEQVIEPAYLDSLRERYYRLWDQYTDAPVYVVDTSQIHYVDSEQDLQTMLAMIQGWLDGRPVPGSPEAYRPSHTPQLSLFTG
jgi:deoxyadenosine/deoxycytidine kinase